MLCGLNHGRGRDLLAVVTKCPTGLLFHEQRIADRDVVVGAVRVTGIDYLVYESAMLLDWPSLADVDSRQPTVACHGEVFPIAVGRLLEAAATAQRECRRVTIPVGAAQR